MSPQRNQLVSCHGYKNDISTSGEPMIQGYSYESEQKTRDRSFFPVRDEFPTYLWRGWLLTTCAQNSSLPLLTSLPDVSFGINKGRIIRNDTS